MSVFAVLFALIIEQFKPLPRDNWVPHTLGSWVDWAGRNFDAGRERHAWVVDAIRREKRIKKWLRDWKLALIERENPDWRDLAADWFPTNDPNWTPPEEPD